MARPRGKPIKVFVTEEEKAEIVRRADSANLSLSSYLRAAGMNHSVRSVMDVCAVTELARIHSELGRIAEEKTMEELRDIQTMIHGLMGRAIR